MLRLRRYVVAGLGVGITAAVITATNLSPAFAQGVLQPLQALIVNTAANPVPVVGRVTALNVPGVQPYTCDVRLSVNGLYNSADCPQTVPVGKRLVVEHLSTIVTAQTGNHAIVALTTPTVGAPVVWAPMVLQLRGLTIDIYVGSLPVRYYVESGEAPRIALSVNAPFGIDVEANVIGYLIDTR